MQWCAEKLFEAEQFIRGEREEFMQAWQREKFERVEYGRTMQVAHQEWRDNNVAAPGLARRTRPDLRGWEWHYVHRLCHSDLLTLKGHTGIVLFGVVQPGRLADRHRE